MNICVITLVAQTLFIVSQVVSYKLYVIFTYPAKTQRAADTICVLLFDTYSTLVTIDLLQVGHTVPVGPGPMLMTLTVRGAEVITCVRGPSVVGG